MNFIEIGISPIAFRLGTFELRWYGVMMVIAIVAIILITLREAKRVGIPDEHVYNVGLWAVIGGIVCSRIVHIIDQWEYYMQYPAQIIGSAGLGVYGAVIGALLATLIYTWVKKLSFWQFGDLIAPGAILGQAIGRLGCFINGCCYGLPTTLPWAVVYTNPDSYALLGMPVHPTQMYHFIWDMAAFAAIWQLRHKLKPQGSLFLLYLALYAMGDLAIRFVRDGEPNTFGMQQAQFIGIVMLAVTVPWLVIRMWRYRAKGAASEATSPLQDRED